MDYYIKIKGMPIPVTEEVYKAYCQGDRKERYFRESDIHNQIFFYDALDTEETNGSDMFVDPLAESVEDVVERRLLLARLKEALALLSDSERELLLRLYLYGESLRGLSRRYQVPVTTLQARHHRILKKLKKYLEK